MNHELWEAAARLLRTMQEQGIYLFLENNVTKSISHKKYLILDIYFEGTIDIYEVNFREEFNLIQRTLLDPHNKEWILKTLRKALKYSKTHKNI